MFPRAGVKPELVSFSINKSGSAGTNPATTTTKKRKLEKKKKKLLKMYIHQKNKKKNPPLISQVALLLRTFSLQTMDSHLHTKAGMILDKAENT